MGTLYWLFGVQVVVVQPLLDVGPEFVQEATPVGPVLFGAQVVVV